MKTNPHSHNHALAPIRMWLAEPLAADVATAVERLRRADDVEHIAIMPDIHLAERVCIGTVLATSHLLYPQAVGADIGCGMTALAFGGEAGVLGSESVATAMLDGLSMAIPVMRHRSRESAPSVSDELIERAPPAPPLRSILHREARVEFGTLGRGNHFLEFQSDEEGRLWLMIHSGSRLMGQRIAEWHASLATRSRAGLFYLDANSPQGQAYLADVEWAISYADASRHCMAMAAAALVERMFHISFLPESLVRCNHNHVRREEHFGRGFWVHRKGANSACAGEPGIIPGSMGTSSLLVTGRGYPQSLCSSSHGAGRRLSRHEARRRITDEQVGKQLDGVWFNSRLAGQLREECPEAYKDINAVMRSQKDLVRVIHRLRPVLCYKGV